MKYLVMVFCIFLSAQAFTSSQVESPAARNRIDTQKNIEKNPACPASNPLCNNPPEKESSTEAPTTRSKNQAQENETKNPPCHVSNPNCNQKWKNENTKPTCPVSDPNCSQPDKK
jgi:hypothetical protein